MFILSFPSIPSLNELSLTTVIVKKHSNKSLHTPKHIKYVHNEIKHINKTTNKSQQIGNT